MPSARATTHVDTDRVRVTTWTFGDGEDTGHHRHEFDYVVVPVTGGTFGVVATDETTREMIQHAGLAYTGSEGTTHNVVNHTGHSAVFVEIELKR